MGFDSGSPIAASGSPIAASGCWRAGVRNYPSNCWWVAAKSSDIGDGLESRWLLDERVVLYRLTDGTINALEDRCPHRWAPLSEGKKDGDQLVCGYHGFKFDQTGACTHVPTQPNSVQSICARRYVVTEHAGFVWVWMGDPGKADPGLLPEIPWFTDTSNIIIGGEMEVQCNYMLLQENVMDLSHFAHLHADTLQQTGWDGPPPQIKTTETTATYEQIFTDVALAPFQAMPMGMEEGKLVNRFDWGTFHSPACHFGGIDVIDPEAKEGERSSYNLRIMHCTTPISPNKCYYWWILAQDYGQSVPGIDEALQGIVEATFKQDKDILEQIQVTVDNDYRGAHMPEFSVKSDFGALQARKILIRMMAAENAAL